MRRLRVLFFLAYWCSMAAACGRDKPPRDHDRPELKCPPDMLNEIASPRQNHKKVNWQEPTAWDSFENRKFSPDREGLPPGRLFSEGTDTIQYTARDRSGNAATCKFKIKVTVVRCRSWAAQTDGWKICHPSHDMRYGTSCRFGCYAGHVLEGPSNVECGSDGRWTVASQPRCKQIQCSKLLPKPEQMGVVNIGCTDGRNYRSICTYSCKEGFSVKYGHSKVRVCGANGNWIGATPFCEDTSPPKFIDCPPGLIFYAGRLKTSGLAHWDKPLVEDNSDIGGKRLTPIQTGGPTAGEELDVGEYDVTYKVKDRAGNTATCQFKVVMKQVKCPTIYPLPYTSVTCPSGRIYGATCNFTCDKGAISTLPMTTDCDKKGATYHYGLWGFGNYQPFCERKNLCVDLRPPDNGALACDIWQYGKFCHMLCQYGYTVIGSEGSQIHGDMFVCSDAGKWLPTDMIPNCGKEGRSRVKRSDADIPLGYYYGPCEEAQEEIARQFIRMLTILPCKPPQCSISNVKVDCGQTVKRSSYSEIVVKVTFELSPNLTYAEVVGYRETLKTSMNEAQTNGSFDVTIGNQTLEAASVEMSALQTTCDEGTVPDLSKPLSCVQCGPGYYQNSTVCSMCAIGFYQDEDGQSFCKQCPPGMTTEDVGSKECKEACPLGFYSPKGTTPCDPCDIGYYTDTEGTREQCQPCPDSKTTNTTASTAVDACFEFDLVFFNMTDGEEPEPPTIEVNSSYAFELSLTMWFRCTLCEDIVTITGIDPDVSITIGGDDTFTTTPTGAVTVTDNTTFSLVASHWQHLYITWSPPSIQLYIDNALVVNGSLSSTALPSSLNVTMGGARFFGEVSQLNMYSFPVLTPNTSVQFDTCLTNLSGDLLSWKNFSDIDGTFVVTRSVCDAFDNCLSLPCQNDGVCFDIIDGYKCACADGFTGSDCSVNIDDCVVSVCDNGGTCVDDVNGYNCSCTPGYRGDLCEIKMVDGRWAQYSEWTLCSQTCGVGYQVRNRTCDSPEPSNGGKECEGDSFQIRECQLQECINECVTDLHPIVNGSLNCEWDSDNETRRCYPKCDDGYDFDSDLFVDPPNVCCGRETGFVWNIRSSENPEARLPSCLEKKSGKTNVLNYTAIYGELSELDDEVTVSVQQIVENKVSNTTCVSQERCNHTNTYIELKRNTSTTGQNMTLYVAFTAQISCEIITNMDECYGFLESLVYEMNDFIDAREMTVNHSGHSYDVTTNNTQLGGTTDCNSGYVPVVNYCIACGEGMYQSGGFCERCPVGYYQDETAKLDCKQCPKEWTTQGLQSKNIMDCNVKMEPSYTLFYAVLFIGLAITLTVAITAFFGDSSMIRYYVLRTNNPCVSPSQLCTKRRRGKGIEESDEDS